MQKRTGSDFFFRINPKGGSHLYTSLTAKMEKLRLHFRPRLTGDTFCSYEHESFGPSPLEISYCYSQRSPVSASDFLGSNTRTHMSQCRLGKGSGCGKSLTSRIKKKKQNKTKNSLVVHPVLLEGVGPQACVLCNWHGYMW